ncbi:MAG: 5-formyltetrahydrofolate cyclo-ligase [Bacilli bacterium]
MKKDKRSATLMLLRALSTEQSEIWSRAIYKQFMQLDALKTCDILFITMAMPHEIPTWPIIEMALQRGIKVAVPLTDVHNKRLVFTEISEKTTWETKGLGILEPSDTTTVCTPSERSIVVVPGVCFSRLGYRIGYGGGYYDRYLEGKQGIKISFAYDLQLDEHIEVEPHDIPVDILLTPNEMIWCMNERKKEKIFLKSF